MIMDLDVGFFGAFVAGLLSFISPCVLPLVPPYLSFLAGVSIDQLTDDDKTAGVTARVFQASFAFVLGFSTVFVALGASASWIGEAVSSHFSTLNYIAGALILILGIHYLGIIRIPILSREARFQTSARPMGLIGAYVVGLAFAFGWTPCVGPVLAAILLYAGSEADVLRGASLLFVYSLGIGLPFLLVSLFAGPFVRMMQRHRHHMGKVEKVIGVLLVLTGILFLTNSMATIAYLMLEWFPAIGTFG